MQSRDQRGVAFPSPLVILSIVAVAMAGLVFVVTQDKTPGQDFQTVSEPSPSPTAKRSTTAGQKPNQQPKKSKPEFRRSDIFVEVYNNSGITGLAGTTASTASGAGWNVVGSDNWYGTIAASTVYFPPDLKAPAKALAKDLGIARLQPAIDPMRYDRLTVILTSDYS
jgi:hypothetical protein